MPQRPTQVINLQTNESPLFQAIQGLIVGMNNFRQMQEEQRRREREDQAMADAQLQREMTLANLQQQSAAATDIENATQTDPSTRPAKVGVPPLLAKPTEPPPFEVPGLNAPPVEDQLKPGSFPERDVFVTTKSGKKIPLRPAGIKPPPLKYKQEVEAEKYEGLGKAAEAAGGIRVTPEVLESIPEVFRGLFPVGKVVDKSQIIQLMKPPRTGTWHPVFGPNNELKEWQNPETQETVPVAAGAYGSGGSKGSPEDVFPGLTGEVLAEALKKENAQDYANVKSMLDGTVDPTGVASMRKGRREYLFGLASRIDSDFTPALAKARYKTRSDFQSGGSAALKRSINTAIRHLGTLDDKINALDPFSQGSMFPRILNAIRNPALEATGDPRITGVRDAALAVATEMAAALKGGVGRASPTEDEIKEQLSIFSNNSSKEQWRSSIKTKAELLSGRLGALGTQWKNAFANEPPPYPLVDKESQKIAKQHGFYDQLGIAAGEFLGESEQPEVPTSVPQTAQPAVPKIGEVVRGYRFKGGNPAVQTSWEKVQ